MTVRIETLRFRYYASDASYFINGDPTGYDYHDTDVAEQYHAAAQAIERAVADRGFSIVDVLGADSPDFATPDVDVVLGIADPITRLAGDIVTYVAIRAASPTRKEVPA